MIVFDASAVVSAALKVNSVPEQALLRAEELDVLAMPLPVAAEIAEALARPKFALALSSDRRVHLLDVILRSAIWFDPAVSVVDCRDAKDNKYLELALAAGAETIVSSDNDLLELHPWRGVQILRPADYHALPIGR